MHVRVRVRPGASRTAVGGAYGGVEDRRLVVAVGARAVDGAATEAARRALAEALGVPARRVRLVSGATARDKVLGVAVEGPAERERIAHRVAALLG